MSFIEVNDKKKKQPTNIIKGDPLDDVCGVFLHRLKNNLLLCKVFGCILHNIRTPKSKTYQKSGR